MALKQIPVGVDRPSRIKQRRNTIACDRFEREEVDVEVGCNALQSVGESSSAAAPSEEENPIEPGCSGIQRSIATPSVQENLAEACGSGHSIADVTPKAEVKPSRIKQRRKTIACDRFERHEVDVEVGCNALQSDGESSSAAALSVEENSVESESTATPPIKIDPIESESAAAPPAQANINNSGRSGLQKFETVLLAATPPSILKRRKSMDGIEKAGEFFVSFKPKRRKSVCFDLSHTEAADALELNDNEKENAGTTRNSVCATASVVQEHGDKAERTQEISLFSNERKSLLSDQNKQTCRAVPDLLPIKIEIRQKRCSLGEFVQYHQDRLNETISKKID